MDRVASPPSFESLKNNKMVRVREGREVKVDNSLLNVITDVSAYVFLRIFSPKHNFEGKSHDPRMIYIALTHSKYSVYRSNQKIISATYTSILVVHSVISLGSAKV